EAVHKELGNNLVRAAITASSLEAEQDSGGGPRVLHLEKTKTTQAEEIASLKRRLKKLEQKKRSRTHGLKRLRKIGATARVESSDDEESLGEDASKQGRIVVVKGVNERSNVVKEVVEVINTAKLVIDAIQVSDAGDKVSAASAPTTVSAATTTTADDITLAQALADLKSKKPKMKGVVIQEPSESTKKISSQQLQGKGLSQDKGKGILVEPEKPLKMKYQIRLDEETALRLQAEFDEEGRLAREKAQKEEEANIALIETWDDIQAKIDADHQLAERLQVQEQEELSIEKKAKLFQQVLETMRKHFAAKRAEENRNKPPIKAQQKNIMSNYLKNMKGYKLKDLKLKETELVEGKEKRAGIELVDKTIKKQKMEDDKETAELKGLMEIDPDKEEATIDVVPLAVKSSTIGDLKTMFEPHIEDEVWKLQQGYKVLSWKLYDSCGVHSLRMQSVHIHMLLLNPSKTVRSKEVFGSILLVLVKL
ncbi:hypothetical protein Tco_0837054, partial [Tanacetum coccineum]